MLEKLNYIVSTLNEKAFEYGTTPWTRVEVLKELIDIKYKEIKDETDKT